MEKNPNVDIFPFEVESFIADKMGRVRPGTLLNHMLSYASRHAEARGFGATSSLGWVLARMALHVEKMPVMHEQYRLHTWVRSIYRGFTDRCVKIVDAEGNEVVSLLTVFAMMDLNTRSAAELNGEIGAHISECLAPDEPLAISRIPSLSRVPVEEVAFRRTPQYSDVDINGHMNSIRCLEHILDSIPKEYMYSHNLTDFVVGYMHEGTMDEELSYGLKSIDEDRFMAQVTKENGVIAQRCELKFAKI